MILAYDTNGAEKLCLVRLAQQLLEYEGRLRAVQERMVDLSPPSSVGNIYDIRMAGLYLLKRSVFVLSDYNYQGLEISYGMDAVEKWREYCTTDVEKKREIYGQPRQHHAMDTYTEYIVCHALEDMTRG